ncbi:MAG: hypothetical protein NT002_03140 [candidate division Zixibacteria bacterium]|nr:hypothetical protein [candidate division Zixibacteria bacterium]
MAKNLFIGMAALLCLLSGCRKDFSNRSVEPKNSYVGQYCATEMISGRPYVHTFYVYFSVLPENVAYDYCIEEDVEKSCEATVPYLYISPDTIDFILEGATFSSDCNHRYDLSGKYRYWRIADSLNMDGIDTVGGLTFKLRLRAL